MKINLWKMLKHVKLQLNLTIFFFASKLLTNFLNEIKKYENNFRTIKICEITIEHLQVIEKALMTSILVFHMLPDLY